MARGGLDGGMREARVVFVDVKKILKIFLCKPPSNQLLN
jgi:hypothetical protein